MFRQTSGFVILERIVHPRHALHIPRSVQLQRIISAFKTPLAHPDFSRRAVIQRPRNLPLHAAVIIIILLHGILGNPVFPVILELIRPVQLLLRAPLQPARDIRELNPAHQMRVRRDRHLRVSPLLRHLPALRRPLLRHRNRDSRRSACNRNRRAPVCSRRIHPQLNPDAVSPRFIPVVRHHSHPARLVLRLRAHRQPIRAAGFRHRRHRSPPGSRRRKRNTPFCRPLRLVRINFNLVRRPLGKLDILAAQRLFLIAASRKSCRQQHQKQKPFHHL